MIVSTPEHGSPNTKRFFFDNGQHEPEYDNSPEITVRHNLVNDERCTILGTILLAPRNFFLHTDEVGDGTDTDHYMQLDAETFSKQLSPTDVNRRTAKYDLLDNLKPNCNDDYRY